MYDECQLLSHREVLPVSSVTGFSRETYPGVVMAMLIARKRYFMHLFVVDDWLFCQFSTSAGKVHSRLRTDCEYAVRAQLT